MAERAQELVRQAKERMRGAPPRKRGKRDDVKKGGKATQEDKVAEQQEEEERRRKRLEKQAKRDQRRQAKKLEEIKDPEVMARLRTITRHQAKALEAQEYLLLWKTDRSAWKFNKHHQTFLLKHMLNPYIVDHASFSILEDYVQSMRGASVDMTQESAQEALEQEELSPQLMQDAEVVYKRFADGKELEDEERVKFEDALRRIIKRRAHKILNALS